MISFNKGLLLILNLISSDGCDNITVVLVTLADLARPYLIKLAIDNHLTAFASNTSSFKEHAGALLRLVLFYLLLIAASLG